MQPNDTFVITIKNLNKDYVEISLKDNGKGIVKENVVNLFEPFFTYDKVNGTGLGLPISKRIVEEHYGEIFFNQENGSWTEFVIKLPIVN
jgi:two-component system sensor histidine kinase AtoS